MEIAAALERSSPKHDIRFLPGIARPARHSRETGSGSARSRADNADEKTHVSEKDVSRNTKEFVRGVFHVHREQTHGRVRKEAFDFNDNLSTCFSAIFRIRSGFLLQLECFRM